MPHSGGKVTVKSIMLEISKTQPKYPRNKMSYFAFHQQSWSCYSTWDDFKKDLTELVNSTWNFLIPDEKDYNENHYYLETLNNIDWNSTALNDNGYTYNRCLVGGQHGNKVETSSYKTNNQVSGFEEKTAVTSDGKFIFIGYNENITVCNFG